jgi:hypothetical protein
LDSLSSKSNYRSAVAKAEKAREKKYQLFLQGEIDKYDEEVSTALMNKPLPRFKYLCS